MKYLLSYFLCTLSLYFPPRMLISTLRVERNSDVDDLIEKLLQSDKFDELANKIAEKAVEKIKDLQYINATKKIKTKNDLKLRGSSERNHSSIDDVTSNFKDDIMKSLIDNGPYGDLSLKYVKFIKKKTNVKHIKNHSTNPKKLDNKVTNNSTEIKAKKKINSMQVVKNRINQFQKPEVKSKNSNSNSASEDDDAREGTNDKRDSETLENDRKKEASHSDGNKSEQGSNNPQEVKYNSLKIKPNRTATSEFNENEFEDNMSSKEMNKQEKENTKSNKYEASTNKPARTKRILGKENDRLYVLESSPEYDNYKDKIYDALE